MNIRIYQRNNSLESEPEQRRWVITLLLFPTLAHPAESAVYWISQNDKTLLRGFRRVL
jgi:hypothetical protein